MNDAAPLGGACALLLMLALPATGTQSLDGPESAGSVQVSITGASPAFIQNLGQWHHSVRFACRTRDTVAWLSDAGVAVGARSAAGVAESARALVRLSFEGRHPDVTLEGGAPVAGRHNFFLGGDLSRWRSNVPAYESVLYRGLYEGIDLRVRCSPGKGLQYDVLLARGARPSTVVIQCDGVDALSVDEDGALLMQTPVGLLRQTPPVCWTESPDGTGRPIQARFVVLDEARYGFDVDDYDERDALVIDPGLEWATYLGASGDDFARAVAFDPSGDVVLVGMTKSASFPVTSGSFDETCNTPASPFACQDAFISRFDRQSGALIYSTYLGGGGGEEPTAVEVNTGGTVTVCGWTNSSDFPVTPGGIAQPGSSRDIFVARLTSDGRSLISSAVIGGNSVDVPYDMAVAHNGDVLVCGATDSSNFPTTPGALDSTKGFNDDGFLLRIDAALSTLVFSTLAGGDNSDSIRGVDVEPGGTIVIAGHVSAGSLPVRPGAFSQTPNGPYVARLSADGSKVLASTYIGGSLADSVHAIASVPNGDVIIAGWTYSSDFPVTPGAFQTTSIGSLFTDGFVTRFDPGLSSLVYSTYLTGGSTVEIDRMVVDSSGAVTVAGVTGGGAFPTTPGAFDTTYNGDIYDAFVSRLAPDGSQLFYSTFLGGSKVDAGDVFVVSVAVDATGAAAVSSTTNSTDFPTTPRAHQPAFAGGQVDAVLAVVDMLPTGTSRYGSSTPGCTGPLAIGVTSMAQVGKPFGLTCTNAPPGSAQGVLFVGPGALSSPVPAKGAGLWVDPLPLFQLLSVVADGLGAIWLQSEVPNSPALVGATIYTQFFFPNPCGPPGQLSASNALAITIQG